MATNLVTGVISFMILLLIHVVLPVQILIPILIKFSHLLIVYVKMPIQDILVMEKMIFVIETVLMLAIVLHGSKLMEKVSPYRVVLVNVHVKMDILGWVTITSTTMSKLCTHMVTAGLIVLINSLLVY